MVKTDFSWTANRGAGIFLHISSLPSEYGVGNILSATKPFFDFLKDSGMSYWQICPLGSTSYGDSPYQSFSAYAGNPYFIDFSELVQAELLEDSQLDCLRNLSHTSCDFSAFYQLIPNILRLASATFKKADRTFELDYSKNFSTFCNDNKSWLEPYALFMALKNQFDGKPWYQWKATYRNYESAKKIALTEDIENEMFSVKFIQWIFFSQYEKFKKIAKDYNIKIFGDLPIFLAHDSADVWQNPSLFELNADGSAINVAGVGPDYFSADGQLWGNPLYDWTNKKKKVYEFWRSRVKAASEMYDVIRFDHFRGFADYWSIPAKTNDAKLGSWKLGPGKDFFAFLKKYFPTQKFVAEDLGLLSDVACNLRDDLKMPAMAVLQFAFGSGNSNAYLPHNVSKECVYYTGTHDNDTAKGWYDSADDKSKDQFRIYFKTDGQSANWDMIHAVLFSVARLAIIPMQDILNLSSDCRFNTPGKPDGNWQWRMTYQQLEDSKNQHSNYLKQMITFSDRLDIVDESNKSHLEVEKIQK